MKESLSLLNLRLNFQYRRKIELFQSMILPREDLHLKPKLNKLKWIRSKSANVLSDLREGINQFFD